MGQIWLNKGENFIESNTLVRLIRNVRYIGRVLAISLNLNFWRLPWKDIMQKQK
jgi:hypothetical protein